MALSFGISFAPNHPREVGEWCRASEEAGFERIGMVDSQAIYRELYISCVAGMQGLAGQAWRPCDGRGIDNCAGQFGGIAGAAE